MSRTGEPSNEYGRSLVLEPDAQEGTPLLDGASVLSSSEIRYFMSFNSATTAVVPTQSMRTRCARSTAIYKNVLLAIT